MANDLGSASVPPVGPGDHIRGQGPEVIVYLDLACPGCARVWRDLGELSLRLCVRHFPIASKRPRAPVLHAATEAASAQGGEEAFWWIWDDLYADRGHADDPHLWARAERLGLDLHRFEADRRSNGVAGRVDRDFRSGIRAGVIGTPTAFVGGQILEGEVVTALRNVAP